jgi:hypothetical protein
MTKTDITDHHDGHGLNELLLIESDGPGSGGAGHRYVVHRTDVVDTVATIQFQHGAPGADGSSPGLTDSALIAIVLDRYRAFQAGPYGCRENALAITKLEEALHWMQHRANERARRGVLGKEKA